jgi:uncharacterized membrane protein
VSKFIKIGFGSFRERARYAFLTLCYRVAGFVQFLLCSWLAYTWVYLPMVTDGAEGGQYIIAAFFAIVAVIFCTAALQKVTFRLIQACYPDWVFHMLDEEIR